MPELENEDIKLSEQEIKEPAVEDGGVDVEIESTDKKETKEVDEIEKYDEDRINNTREKLIKNLNEFVEKNAVDKNRFEQELIYYLEKFDITEEKVRLKTHCDYFLKTMQLETSEGRKLGFISQEIGREINTIGSKANNADIQKLVVQMKDDLEKIKEQMLNIL